LGSRKTGSSLFAPFLKKVSIDKKLLAKQSGYPFDLPWIKDQEFELNFTTPVTIIVGENGTGKSTLIEAIAGFCGYDESGGGKGYRPVDHSVALDKSGARLGEVMRAAWLPKVTSGWFFKAESFFSVARYLDEAAREPLSGPPPDYLSWSHGEGFIRFFEERLSRRGIYFMDEPESALSPRRQMELLSILNRMNEAADAQLIMATHSPILMALPNATLLEMTRFGLQETDFRETSHFKLYQSFTADPEEFVAEALKLES